MAPKMSEAEQVMRDPRSYAAGAIVLKASEVATVLSELDRLRESAPKDVRSEVIAENAAEMFKTLQYWACQRNVAWEWDEAIDSIQEDVAKIEAQIAAAEKARATGGEGI